ncbi:SDR family NAD(P)-dependent oxidoreductase [Paraburkholderia solisilvae]|uniref:SDR family NAD(P)-dependent oxidoreductase n=1 Tax=Paraburkholderia solisilvae TaxID=624376 RepID=UPI001FE534CE|nr:SDR family NAD(P)-dependent oxidoreductase [Paraburkholderia solisilvae]
MKIASPVALVTGSTSGIGAAIARRLSSEGFSVVLHSRSSVETGQALARELGSATYVQADLADDANRVRLIREAVAAWGRLDVLVNNAGISRVIPHADLAAATPAVWSELYEVNVIAPFRLIAEAEPALRDAARTPTTSDLVSHPVRDPNQRKSHSPGAGSRWALIALVHVLSSTFSASASPL